MGLRSAAPSQFRPPTIFGSVPDMRILAPTGSHAQLVVTDGTSVLQQACATVSAVSSTRHGPNQGIVAAQPLGGLPAYQRTDDGPATCGVATSYLGSKVIDGLSPPASTGLVT